MKRKGLMERLDMAYGQDKSIITERNSLNEAQGHDPEYLDMLGLDKTDMKRLERMGRAIRGYTRNIWLAGDTRPDGSQIPDEAKYSERGKGHKVKWVILKD